MKQKYFNKNRWITSCDLGQIIPIFIEPTLPESEYIIKPNLSIKFQPFADNAVGSLRLKVSYHYVDMSLIWTDYKKFWAERAMGSTTTTAPYMSIAIGGLVSVPDNLLLKKFGVPELNNDHAIDINALPFRTYWKIIWDEFYRVDGSIATIDEGDFFIKTNGLDATTLNTVWCDYYPQHKDYRYNSVASQMDVALPTIAAGDDINDFKTFLITSRMAEFVKKITTQSSDLIKKFFSAKSIPSDSSQKIIEFEKYIAISEIFSNAETDTNIVGASVSLAQDHFINEIGGKKFVAPNYGYIMGVLSIIPETSEFYSNLPEFLIHHNNLETLPNPAYANLGYMPINEWEVGMTGTWATDTNVTCYRPIYEPIRMGYNVLAGKFTESAYQSKVICRLPANTMMEVNQIDHAQYDYLFTSDLEPQARIYVINEVTKWMDLPKTLDYITIEKIMSTQSVI